MPPREVSDQVELITMTFDDGHGCTYRASDISSGSFVKKQCINKKPRVESSTSESNATMDPSNNIIEDNQTMTNLPASTTTDADAPDNSVESFDIEPVRPPKPFNSGNMSTIVVYGWEPWEPVIGKRA